MLTFISFGSHSSVNLRQRVFLRQLFCFGIKQLPLYHVKMNMLGNQSYLPRRYYVKLSFPSLPVTSGKEGWFDSFSVLFTLIRVASCSSLCSIPPSCPHMNKSAVLWAGSVLLQPHQKVLRYPLGAKPSLLTCQFQETISICLVKHMLHCCALNLSC